MIIEAFTKPYCQMTAVDSFIVALPILIIAGLIYFWKK
jgi:hypothetical protein